MKIIYFIPDKSPVNFTKKLEIYPGGRLTKFIKTNNKEKDVIENYFKTVFQNLNDEYKHIALSGVIFLHDESVKNTQQDEIKRHREKKENGTQTR